MGPWTDAIGLLRSFLRHRAHINAALGFISEKLAERAREHDLSKLLDDEFEGFSRINAAARINKFGSPEYAEGLSRERETIDLHFRRNRHHPERARIVAGFHSEPDDYKCLKACARERMTFVDIIEMVCDWWAARKGYDDQRLWTDTVESNIQSKGPLLTPEQLWLVRSVAELLEGVE